MSSGRLYRLAAFAAAPGGGNPAGVWVGEDMPDTDTMQRIAAEVGFSETAFVTLDDEEHLDRGHVKYFSPVAEVPFCGHATIAAGVVLGELHGDGWYELEKADGQRIRVLVGADEGVWQASFWSDEPRQEPAAPALVQAVSSSLGWSHADMDAAIPPVRAYAGAWHLVLAARRARRLATLEYDFDRLRGLMQQHDLTTLQLIWRESPTVFVSRNPFPVGGIVEDPATGAAAAALGGYLRVLQGDAVPERITIRQGEAMGRPSRIDVRIPPAGGIVVTGTAHHLSQA